VLQTGLYLSVLGPSYVYVRYRCGRCKRVGEKLVEQESWDPCVLGSTKQAEPERDLGKFEKMGEITAEEVINFHFALERLGAEAEIEEKTG
jgi:hypothetical protein